jgi:hypothetical protein
MLGTSIKVGALTEGHLFDDIHGFGMAPSNLVAIVILLTAGASLHAAGKADIESSQIAAEELHPIGRLLLGGSHGNLL